MTCLLCVCVFVVLGGGKSFDPVFMPLNYINLIKKFVFHLEEVSLYFFLNVS